MILEPRKTAEEVDRRLSALNDPELTELLQNLNRRFSSDDLDSYSSPTAPYWKKRIGLIALAGLLAMSTGYAFSISASHPNARAKAHAIAIPPPRHHTKAALRRAIPQHAAVSAVRPTLPAAPLERPALVSSPNETLVRQARAQLVHERALVAEAQHQAAQARQAAMAREWAQAEALAQARAEARAEAAERAQAQAEAQRAEEQAAKNAQDEQVSQADTPPSDTGRISTYPVPGMPVPMPAPIDVNCTPHRGSLFRTVLDHVSVGGANVGGLLRLVGH